MHGLNPEEGGEKLGMTLGYGKNVVSLGGTSRDDCVWKFDEGELRGRLIHL